MKLKINKGRYYVSLQIKTDTLGVNPFKLNTVTKVGSHTPSGVIANLTALYLNGDYLEGGRL